MRSLVLSLTRYVSSGKLSGGRFPYVSNENARCAYLPGIFEELGITIYDEVKKNVSKQMKVLWLNHFSSLSHVNNKQA